MVSYPAFKIRNLYQVVGGRIPDGKNVMQRARDEAFQYKQNYAINIPGSVHNIQFSALFLTILPGPC